MKTDMGVPSPSGSKSALNSALKYVIALCALCAMAYDLFGAMKNNLPIRERVVAYVAIFAVLGIVIEAKGFSIIMIITLAAMAHYGLDRKVDEIEELVPIATPVWLAEVATTTGNSEASLLPRNIGPILPETARPSLMTKRAATKSAKRGTTK